VLVLERGAVGESYNFGGGAEQTNIEVAQALCALMDVINPGSAHCPHSGLIRFVADRPGHDLRYAIDWSKARDELGWQPQETFDSGLHKTLAWYLANEDWCAVARSDGYGGERLGLGRVAGA
jgi:dTDP-glucose 4,6-dehydratase